MFIAVIDVRFVRLRACGPLGFRMFLCGLVGVARGHANNVATTLPRTHRASVRRDTPEEHSERQEEESGNAARDGHLSTTI